VRCFDAEEFPALPVMEGKIKREMPAPLFRRMVKQVAVAAASDEIRPLFTGILLDMQQEKLVMVATDTHRMAVGECSCGGEEEAKVILPCRNMQEIARLAVNDDEPVYIVTDKNQVYFRTGSITFISRVISGQYPEYKQVLPAPSLFSAQASLEKQKFLEALERASLVVRETGRLKGNAVRLQWLEEVMFLSADVPDVGKIKEEIKTFFEGKPLESSYNARYLLEALRVMEGERVVMRLTGATSPSIIVPEDNQDYIYLVLPLRVAQ
ncbi:MAG: DNA polymerase III subunit beta, partial [Clostridiales bacterium]|nr:DNA polymerase III subunit beta [Clostridiales bacterium]